VVAKKKILNDVEKGKSKIFAPSFRGDEEEK
jgi:hypothetical protein